MPRSSEEVRQHFHKIECSDGATVKYRCNIGACTTVITMKKSEATSTSVLRRHLASQAHNMTEYLAGGDVARALAHAEQVDHKRARHGLENFGFNRTPGAVFFKLEKADQSLVTVMLESYDIISHLRTFNGLYDVGQRVLKRVMNAPHASKERCRAMIDHWFREFLDLVTKELQDVEFIALTSDGWTNYANEHFATITLHFMRRGFAKMESRCIACVHERDNVISAEVIARDLHARLIRIGWPLEKLVVAVTTDEGSNFRALVTRALRAETGAMQAMVANVPLLPLPQERRVSPEEVIAAYRAAENMASDATQDQVLEWFRERKSEGRFAIMLKVAEKCIFVPAASAPSERVASTAGQTYTKRRIRLQATIAEAIIVLHEAKRQVAHRIVDMAPELIRESLEHAFGQEGVENEVRWDESSSADDDEQQQQASDDDF